MWAQTRKQTLSQQKRRELTLSPFFDHGSPFGYADGNEEGILFDQSVILRIVLRHYHHVRPQSIDILRRFKWHAPCEAKIKSIGLR